MNKIRRAHLHEPGEKSPPHLEFPLRRGALADGSLLNPYFVATKKGKHFVATKKQAPHSHAKSHAANSKPTFSWDTSPNQSAPRR
jgi:hypothetical protein